MLLLCVIGVKQPEKEEKTMKLDCEVIRDLLPLYAEHMASPASTALVEEHLQECEACRAELEQMQLPVPVQPEPQPDAPLKVPTLEYRAG